MYIHFILYILCGLGYWKQTKTTPTRTQKATQPKKVVTPNKSKARKNPPSSPSSNRRGSSSPKKTLTILGSVPNWSSGSEADIPGEPAAAAANPKQQGRRRSSHHQFARRRSFHEPQSETDLLRKTTDEIFDTLREKDFHTVKLKHFIHKVEIALGDSNNDLATRSIPIIKARLLERLTEPNVVNT